MRKAYVASFEIDSRNQKETLDEVTELLERWARSKLGERRKIQNFRETCNFERDNRSLRTLAVQQGNAEYFGMSLTHPDMQNRDLLWKASVAIEQNPAKKINFVTTIENGWATERISPARIRVGRPKFIPQIVKNHPTSAGGYNFLTKPAEIGVADIQAFTKLIDDPQRLTPFVFVSVRNRTGAPLIDEYKLTDMLSGVAHVFVAEDIQTSRRLEEIGGRRLGCYNGAIRVYWPLTPHSTNKVHPLLLPDQYNYDCAFNPDICEEILENISDKTSSRQLPITYEKIRRIARDVQLEHARENKGLEELLVESEAENALLRKQIAELQNDLELEQIQHTLNLEESLAENDRLQETIECLQTTIKDLSKQPTGDTDKPSSQPEQYDPAEHVKTAQDAVEQFMEQYPNSSVIITSRAKKGAKSCPYRRPLQIYRALEWLATEYLKPNNKQGRAESCQQQCQLEYKRKQSPKTMGEFKSDYCIQYKGSNYILEEHIRKGKSSDSKDSLSIAFAHDPKRGEIIVGYIGLHQRNRKSN